MSIIIDEVTNELDNTSPEPLSHIDLNKIPHGTLIVGQDTRLYQKRLSNGEIELSPLYKDEKSNKDEIIRIMQMAAIRDCVKEAFDHYYSGQQLEVNRDLSRLNSLYDSFVKEYGYLNSRKSVAML